MRDIDVSGKRVLMRVDYNVPMDVASGRILDDKRIRATLPTLDYLRLEGARVVLLSHLGRPKGKRDPSLSLAPVAARLAELMGEPVQTADDCIGTVVQDAVAALTDGDVLLLENVRFHPEEEANEEEFAKALASLGDVFVNDAFGVAHRASASTEGVAHLRPAVAGFLMESEINFLSRAVEEPERPYAAIIGGAKVSSKMAVIEALLERVDKLMLGGGMANTFLKAEGFDVAESLVEDDYMAEAKRIEEKASELDGVAQDPGRRRLDELAGVQARRLAQRLGQRPRVAGDQPMALQAAEQRPGGGLGERVRDGGLAPELHRPGQAGRRDRVLRKPLGEPGEGRRERLVEGAAARVLGEQDRAAAELGGDVPRQGPVLRDQEQVYERLVVAVQVEHQIGIDGLAGQDLAQGIQLRERRQFGHRFEQGGADRRHVGRPRPGPLAARFPGRRAGGPPLCKAVRGRAARRRRESGRALSQAGGHGARGRAVAHPAPVW